MAVVSGTIMTLKILGKMVAKKITASAAKGMAKKAVKKAVKSKIKKTIKSKLTRKKVKGKDIAQKMFGGGEEGGGALVASPAGPLVSAPGGALTTGGTEEGGALVATKSSAAKELGLEPFMNSLTSIHTSVDAIKAALNENNKDAQDRIEDQRLLNNKLNKEEREAALEDKGGGLKEKLLKPGKDVAEGFLSKMARFFTATILGSLITSLMGGAKDVIFMFRVAIEAIKKGVPLLVNGIKALKASVGNGLKLVLKPFKAAGKLVSNIFTSIGKRITGIVGKALKWADDAFKAIVNAATKAFPKIANALSKGKEFAGNIINKGKNLVKNTVGKVLNKGKNLVKNVAGKAGKFIKGVGSKAKGFIKGGIGKVGKFVSKLFGKNAAKAVAGPAGKTIFKSLAKGAKAIKIPVIGPLLVAVTSMLSGEPLSQTLFKTIGAAAGGALGLALGPIGMFVGELAGEFLGDVLYEGFMGKGWGAAVDKLKAKFQQILSGGKKVAKWLGGGIGRFIENVVKTDPIPIEEGAGRRSIATKLAKFIGIYDWLSGLGFAKGKDGQIDKFPNFLNILFPWKSLPLLVKSFFPPGGGDEEGSAEMGSPKTNTDAEDVSESASYEDGAEDTTVVVDGGEGDQAAAPASSGGGTQIIPVGVDKLTLVNSQYELSSTAALYKV